MLCLVLFCVGIYCIIRKRHIIKIIIGIIICEYAVNLFFILIAYRVDGRAPIFSSTALLVAIAMRIYEKYGTFDITEIKELKG
jgi:multisubunit Na+/H+ antiporter MnhC subunit